MKAARPRPVFETRAGLTPAPLHPAQAFPCSSNLATTLLLGLGNDLLSDDAIGLNIVQAIRGRLGENDKIDVTETAEMGLSLLDMIVGYNTLVMVDAVQTGQASPGFLHELNPEDLKVLPRMSPHFLGIGEILALARELDLAVPERVKIFAIEVADPFTMGTQMTSALTQALPSLVEQILASLREFASRSPAEATQPDEPRAE